MTIEINKISPSLPCDCSRGEEDQIKTKALESLAFFSGSGDTAHSLAFRTIPDFFHSKTQSIKPLIIPDYETTPSSPPEIGDYAEVTKRLKSSKKDDLTHLEAYCDQHKAQLEAEALELKNQIETASCSELTAYFNEKEAKHLFLVAFQGYRSLLVSFSLLCRIAELLTIADKKKEILDPLAEKGKWNPQAKEILKKGIKEFLTDEQQALFFEKVQEMPREDRLIVLFDTEEIMAIPFEYFKENPKEAKDRKMGEILSGKQGFNLLNFVNLWGDQKRIIPSLSMFQEVLKIQFPDSFTTINPVFGISRSEQIRLNGLTQTRDLALHYVKVKEDEPFEIVRYEEADGFKCIENDFECHDRYHTWVTSAIPIEYKHASIALADFIALFAKANKKTLGEQNYRSLRLVSWTFKDMDERSFALGTMLKTVDSDSEDAFLALMGSVKKPEDLYDSASIFGRSLATLLIILDNFSMKKALIDFSKEKKEAQEIPFIADLVDFEEAEFASLSPFEELESQPRFFKILLEEMGAYIPSIEKVKAEFNRVLKSHILVLTELIELNTTFLKNQETKPDIVTDLTRVQNDTLMKSRAVFDEIFS